MNLGSSTYGTMRGFYTDTIMGRRCGVDMVNYIYTLKAIPSVALCNIGGYSRTLVGGHAFTCTFAFISVLADFLKDFTLYRKVHLHYAM